MQLDLFSLEFGGLLFVNKTQCSILIKSILYSTRILKGKILAFIPRS